MESWVAALFVWEWKTCLSSTREAKPPQARGTQRAAHDAEAAHAWRAPGCAELRLNDPSICGLPAGLCAAPGCAQSIPAPSPGQREAAPRLGTEPLRGAGQEQEQGIEEQGRSRVGAGHHPAFASGLLFLLLLILMAAEPWAQTGTGCVRQPVACSPTEVQLEIITACTESETKQVLWLFCFPLGDFATI